MGICRLFDLIRFELPDSQIPFKSNGKVKAFYGEDYNWISMHNCVNLLEEPTTFSKLKVQIRLTIEPVVAPDCSPRFVPKRATN